LLVQLENVSKSFTQNGSEIKVLQEINLEIAEGEFVCMVGPSGCGKSTLLYMIAGLEKPSSGRVRVEGVLVTGPGTDRVVVFQEAALFPWLNVRQNVEFGLKVAGMTPVEKQRRVEKYLKMVHLGRFAEAHPHQLSGGMKQRVAIARALAMDPKILLMDEPFAALDAQTRRLLQDELVDIWKQTHKTILFVTHNVREATALGDKVLEMSARPGRIKKGYAIHLPKPRREADPHLIVIQQRILLSLQEEIAKVAKEEDLDYLIEREASPLFDGPAVGGSL
jgi:NitT/TauT family transport system ATP-binding protein